MTQLTRRERHVPVALDQDEDYTAYLERLPEEKRVRIQKSTNRMQTGLHAVAPITCPGPATCPFITHCPIPEIDDEGMRVAGPARNYPVGRSCVMERLYMQAKIEEYYNHLEVDTRNPVEVSLVNELALLDLYKNRALIVLSAGDSRGEGRDFIKTDVIGYANNGDDGADLSKPLTASAIHPAFDVIEKLERRRASLLDKLLETRKARGDMQHKLGQQAEDSQLLQEITAVRQLLLKRAETAAPHEQGMKVPD